MQTAFKSQAMKGYTETINSIYDKHLALWTQQDDLNFFEAIKTCLMDVAMQVFIGRNEKPETLALLTREFEYLVNGMSHIVPWAAPGTAKRRAIKARQWIENYLHEVLPEKRRIVSNDMFSYFCHEEKGSGELYSDEEVVAHIIFLLFATHDTTACALTNSLYELVQQPRYLQQLREEVQALGPDVPAYNALDQMKLAQAVFNETLRLHPGAPMSARETTRPTTIGEFQVPANVPLFVFNFGIHRHPDYWERPDEFDPQRWLTTETAARHPFAFVPFGGGAHKCVGMHFSMMEYKLLLFKLMTGFEVTLATPQVSAINLLPMPHPKDGLRLRIRAR
jgi:cytochrome P450